MADASSADSARLYVPGGICSREMECFGVCTRIFDVSFCRVSVEEPGRFLGLLEQHLRDHPLLLGSALPSLQTWTASDPRSPGTFFYRCVVVFNRPLPFSVVETAASQLRGLFQLDCVGFVIVYSVPCSLLFHPRFGLDGDVDALVRAAQRKHSRQAVEHGVLLVSRREADVSNLGPCRRTFGLCCDDEPAEEGSVV